MTAICEQINTFQLKANNVTRELSEEQRIDIFLDFISRFRDDMINLVDLGNDLVNELWENQEDIEKNGFDRIAKLEEIISISRHLAKSIRRNNHLYIGIKKYYDEFLVLTSNLSEFVSDVKYRLDIESQNYLNSLLMD